MNSGAHAVGRAELRHPDEKIDAQLLRPGQVDVPRVAPDPGDVGGVTIQDRNENDARREGHEARDEPFFEMIEDAVERAHEYAARGGRARVSRLRGRLI